MNQEINIDDEIKNPKGIVRVDEEFITSENIEMVRKAQLGAAKARMVLDKIPFKVIVTKDNLIFKKESK